MFTIWKFPLLLLQNNPFYNRLFQTTIKRRVPRPLRVNQRKQPVLLKRALLKRAPQRKVPQRKQRPKAHLQVQRGLLQDQRLPGHLQLDQQVNRHHQDHLQLEQQVNRRHQDLQPNPLQDHPLLVHLRNPVILRSPTVQHNHKDPLHVRFTHLKDRYLNQKHLNRLHTRMQLHRK